MNVRKKAILSLIFSAFFVAAIIVYYWLAGDAVVPISDMAEKEVMIFAIFLLFFLIIFFILNIKQHKRNSPPSSELSARPPCKGLLAAASSIAENVEKEPLPVEVILERDGVHYINSDIINNNADSEKLNKDFLKLVESVINKV